VRRVVFDANIWVSSFAFPGPVPRAVIALAHMRQVRSVLSEPVIDQVIRRLTKFGWSADMILDAKLDMMIVSHVVVPDMGIDAIASKPSDNRILECAVAGHADLIVSGDAKHLIPLGHYEGIPIVSPRMFLQMFTRGFP
jgi:uncharacterized protein